MRWTDARDRETYCSPDPTSRFSVSTRVCCMKPPPQPRSIRVLRHAHDFCASLASSQVFSPAARAVPSAPLTQAPVPSLIQPVLHASPRTRNPPHLNPATFKSHRQALPSSRCIENASAHPNVIHDSSQGRFRYSPKTNEMVRRRVG